MRRFTPFLVLLVVVTWARAAADQLDTIDLVNGATLVGEIVSDKDDVLVFRDTIVGEVTLADKDVKSRSKIMADAEAPGIANPNIREKAKSGVASSGQSKTAHTAGAVSKRTYEKNNPPPETKPGTVEEAPVASVAGPTESNPDHVHWTKMLQMNYAFVSGAAPALGIGNTTSIGANLVIERASPENIANFDGSYNRSRSDPGPASVDNQTYTFEYDHIFSSKWRAISRSTYLKNEPMKIQYRFEELAGVGYTVADTPKAFLLVAPGLGYSQGNSQFTGFHERHSGYGLFDSFKYSFTKALSLEQRFFLFKAFDDPNYYVFSSYVGLKGQIAKGLAMVNGLNIVHDNELPPGIKETDYQLQSGIQVSF